MYRKYFFAEVVIVLLLSHVGWNGPSTTLLSCSYHDSRIVQYVIHKKILPILARYRVSMPLDCPFHTKRALFSWPPPDIGSGSKGGRGPYGAPPPARGREEAELQEWLCPLCGLRFHCQDKLLRHWEDVHYRATSGIEDAVCLANFCDIMRCSVMGRRLLRRDQRRGGGGWSVPPASDLPSPPVDDEGDGPYQGPLPTPVAGQSRALGPLVSSCDAQAMQALQDKCKSIIRQCTVGLLVHLSLKDFEDIEDEMNKAVCSYLTCEKFWNDNITESRQVPVLLCLVIGIIMIGGFSLCYYIVWILFDSPLQEEASCSGLNFSSSLYAFDDTQQQQQFYASGAPGGCQRNFSHLSSRAAVMAARLPRR